MGSGWMPLELGHFENIYTILDPKPSFSFHCGPTCPLYYVLFFFENLRYLYTLQFWKTETSEAEGDTCLNKNTYISNGKIFALARKGSLFAG